MNARPDGVRARFWLWTAAMVALGLLYALRIAPQLRVDTNLISLLPAAEQDAGVAAAQRHHSESLSHQLLVLIGTPERQQAIALARQFAQRLREAPGFARVRLEADEAETPSRLYQQHRYGLLDETQRELLRSGQGQQLQDQALQNAYGLGMSLRALPVVQDPFNFLGAFLAAQTPAVGKLRLDHGVLMASSGTEHYVLVGAEISGEAFASSTQDQVIPVYEAAAAQAREAGAQVLGAGVILHAAEAARRARQEISLVGSLSVAGVALMVLLTFRSWRPLVLSALVLGTGAIAAMTACQLLFGRVTLIALVFGSGLIGVAVDYSTHFLADQFRSPLGWTPRQALRQVGPSIAMGMGCALLGYMSLGLTPLPGLRQMAVFSSVGLAVACCGVLCWYPVLAPSARRGSPLPLRWAVGLDAAMGKVRIPRPRLVLAAAVALALMSLSQLRFADDVRLLYSPAPRLVQDEARVRELLGEAPDSQFFLVRGPSADATLVREEKLRASLDAVVADGSLDGYRALTQALPSPQRQRSNRALLATQVYSTQGLAPKLMQQLGFSAEQTARQLEAFNSAAPPLRMAPWLTDPASTGFRELWMGRLGTEYATVVSLSGVRNPAALRAVAHRHPGVSFVDRVAEVSDILRRYRDLTLVLLGAAYGLVGLAMTLRYGLRTGMRLLLAPLGAGMLTLTLLGAMGGTLNLFHVLGLFVVLGLGVDYAVFLREGAHSRPATVLAISLSTLGALLSYGLLAFSATPFIRAIGLTLLFGVGSTYALALWLQRPPPPAGAPAA